MRQNGSALLIVMLVVMMLGIWLFSDMPQSNSGNSEQDNASVLAAAKEALVGRAILDPERPGSLPCPDTDNDGVADLFHGSECPSYVGRLPWKTLGLPDPRDAHGERLWYVLSRNFTDNDFAEPINSDTKGTLKVFAADGTTDLTPPGSEAVALIFAPGAALGTQIRDAVAASCLATGKNVSRNLCPDNYLDSASGFDNASPIGPFIEGTESGTFNDQMRIVRAKDIMPLVEKRVAKTLLERLATYRSEHGYYPYPAKHDACSASQCDSDATVCRGRIPKNAEAAGTEALSLPPWFIPNQWYREIYYSVGADSLKSSADLDPPCGHRLVVSGEQVDMVFFTPGTPLDAIARPSDTLSDYLEDNENQDGWSAGANDVYVVPTSTLNDRDRIYTLP